MGIRWGSVTSRTHAFEGLEIWRRGKGRDNGNTPQNKCRAVKFLPPKNQEDADFPQCQCAFARVCSYSPVLTTLRIFFRRTKIVQITKI